MYVFDSVWRQFVFLYLHIKRGCCRYEFIYFLLLFFVSSAENGNKVDGIDVYASMTHTHLAIYSDVLVCRSRHHYYFALISIVISS